MLLKLITALARVLGFASQHVMGLAGQPVLQVVRNLVKQDVPKNAPMVVVTIARNLVKMVVRLVVQDHALMIVFLVVPDVVMERVKADALFHVKGIVS